jgi:hypothetical protein
VSWRFTENETLFVLANKGNRRRRHHHHQQQQQQ